MSHWPRIASIGIVLLPLLVSAGHAANLQEVAIGVESALHEFLPQGTRAIGDETSPVRLRIGDIQLTPAAGDYDIHFELRQPGIYDLRDFLRLTGNQTLKKIDPIPVNGVSHLPADDQGILELAAPAPLPAYGGYTVVRRIAIVLWCAVLIAILFWRRKKVATTTPDVVQAEALPDRSERFATLLEAARTRPITAAETLEMELHLLSIWRDRLHLSELPADQAIRRLRDDADTAPLLHTIDEWVYVPPTRSTAAHWDTFRSAADAAAGAGPARSDIQASAAI